MSPRTRGWWHSFRPRLADSFLEGSVRLGSLPADLFAGLTVGVVALPLAMAFAIASGVGPEKGLFTAIVAGGLISLLSGSRYQIGGPTGAFVVVVFAVIQRHGYDGLALATLLAGGLLLVLAVSGLGALVRFIPYPVTTGFTTGIAVIIFTSQVKDLLGLHPAHNPADFVDKWLAYGGAIGTFQPLVFVLGLACLAVLIALRRWAPRLPGALIVVSLAAAAVWLLGLPIETIQDRFGPVPSLPPAPSLPAVSMEKIVAVFPDAITIAALAAIESLLSAVVADGMTGDSHKPNAELLAQGVANIGSVLFGGIPATGAIARTATNIRAGARTPLSGLVHALTLLGFMILAAPLVGRIPLVALAAVLVIVAWNMSELDKFRAIFRAPRSDTTVLLVTFALTVLIDLNVAIQVGLLLAALLFMKRMIQVGKVGPVDWLGHEEMDPANLALRLELPGVEIYEIHGPFFFGIADRLKHVLEGIQRPPRAFILRMRHVPAIDATGLHALRLFHDRCRRRGTVLILSGVQEQPRRALHKAGLFGRLGAENVCDSIDIALDRARAVIGLAEAMESGDGPASRETQPVSTGANAPH